MKLNWSDTLSRSMYPEAPASKKIVSKKRALVTTPPLRTRASASKTDLGSPMAESPTKKVRIGEKPRVLGSPMEESPTKKVRIAKEPRTPQRKTSASPSKLYGCVHHVIYPRTNTPLVESQPLTLRTTITSRLSNLRLRNGKQLPFRQSCKYIFIMNWLHTDSENSISNSKAKATSEDDDNESTNPFQDEDSVKPAVYQQDLTTLTVKSVSAFIVLSSLLIWSRNLPKVCEVDDQNLHDPLLEKRNLYDDLPNLL